MEINSLVFNHFNRKNHRVEGRYRATDIYKMKMGDLTPQNYYDDRQVDWNGIANMFPGMGYESVLNEILKDYSNVQQQTKYVIEIPYSKEKNIQLVFVTDYELPDRIIEAKFPTRLREEISSWHKDQFEIQYRGTGKTIYELQFLGRDDVKKYKKLCIIFKYKPSLVRWNNIQKRLINFHKQFLLWQTKKKH